MFLVKEMSDLEPRKGWRARRKWRKARRCVNCRGRGTVKVGSGISADRWDCPNCGGYGYYRAGRLSGDQYRDVSGPCPSCGAGEKRYCHGECRLFDPCQPH